MAVVYLARQTDLDRWVALKELHPEPRDGSVVKRFLRESRLAGSLSHPNIVTVLDFFEVDGTGYIAMEYVPRGSLRPYVGGLTFAQVAGVLEGVLAGLSCAEREGIVHRDLKPENVMVTADGRVKLADFGIAKATGATSMLTATGTTLGTPHYMAPEQAMGQAVGPWTDLYSVGCMAYELVTGRLPFGDTEAPMAVLLRHINEAPGPGGLVAPDVDPRLSDWISVLMAKDPAARPQSAAEAWETLEELVLAVAGPRWRRTSALPATRHRTGPGPVHAAAVERASRPPGLRDLPRPDRPPAGRPDAARRARRAARDPESRARRRAPHVDAAVAARAVRSARSAIAAPAALARRDVARAAPARAAATAPSRRRGRAPRHRGAVVAPRSSPCRSPASPSSPRRLLPRGERSAAAVRGATAHGVARRRRSTPARST